MFKAKSLNNSIRCILNCILLNMFNLRRVTNNFKRFCPEFSPLSMINRIDTLPIDTPSMFHILFYGCPFDKLVSPFIDWYYSASL